MLVLVLLVAAIAVQVAYLRGMARSGELPGSVKVVTGANIALLGAIALGLVVYLLVGRLG